MAAECGGLYFMFLAPPPSEISGSATGVMCCVVCFNISDQANFKTLHEKNLFVNKNQSRGFETSAHTTTACVYNMCT